MEQPAQEKKSNKALLIVVIIIVVVLGAVAVVYFTTDIFDGILNKEASNENAVNNDILNDNNGITASLTVSEVMELLGNVTSAHYELTSVNDDAASLDSLLNGRKGDIELPDRFSDKFANPILSDDEIEEMGMAAMGLGFWGSETIGIDGVIYHRIDIDALREANIIDETISDEDMDDRWFNSTYEELNLYPAELFYLQNLSELAENIEATGNGTYQGSIDYTLALSSGVSQPITFGFSQRFPSDFSNVIDLSDDGESDRFEIDSNIFITLSNDGTLDSIRIEYEIVNSSSETSTSTAISTFTNFNKSFNIAMPPANDIAPLKASDLNYYRLKTAENLVSAIKTVYADSTLPIAEKTVRLDEFTNATVASLLQELQSYTLANVKGTTAEEESEFWQKVFTDPRPQDYYFGYMSADGKQFTISYIQEQDEEFSMGCESEEGDCVATLEDSL